MVFYENFNTTNQTVATCLAHQNFVGPIEEFSCDSVESFPPDKRCQFVVDSQLCSQHVQFVDYIYIYYCVMNKGDSEIIRAISYIFNIIVCLYFFVVLTVVVDKFFCPALATLGKILHFSENIAGITLLAFANSAPDFLTSFSSLNEDNKMLVSQIIGGSLFITTLITGLIIAIKPFAINKWVFLRDIACLIIVLLLFDIFIYPDNIITTRESLTFPVLYIVYLVIVFVDQHLARLLHEGTELSFISTSSYIKEEENCRNLWLDFIKNIKPFTLREWEESSCFNKFLTVITAPIIIVLKLLVPIVDSTERNDGWCKLLNCCQIVLLPTAIVYVMFSSPNTSKWLIILITALVFSVIAGVVFWRTKIAEKPRLHKFFIFYSVLGSIFIMWLLTHEVINIIGLIGIVLRLSPAFVGCTLFSWGGTVGDLMADISLARHDFQEMALAGTIGSPLFNILLSLGIVMIYKSYKGDNTYDLPVGSISHNCLLFLIIVLIFVCIGLYLTNFQARRSLGIFLIMGYIIFLFGTILVHFEIIHAYGTDHRIDNRFQESEISFDVI